MTDVRILFSAPQVLFLFSKSPSRPTRPMPAFLVGAGIAGLDSGSGEESHHGPDEIMGDGVVLDSRNRAVIAARPVVVGRGIGYPDDRRGLSRGSAP
jgi:hypothetical protein